MTIRSVIAGCGSYLPPTVVTNAELEKRVDTTDEWIVQRTGIRERHISRDDEPSSMMAAMAAREAMKQGGFINSDIDGVIVATSTPDHDIPFGGDPRAGRRSNSRLARRWTSTPPVRDSFMR